MSEGKNYFSKIGTVAEREAIFTDLSRMNPSLYVFDRNLKRLVFSIETVAENHIVARLKQGEVASDNEMVTIHFSLNETQYFLKGCCQFLKPAFERRYQIDFSGEIYKLQRRSNFRVKVPEGKAFKAEITEIGHQSVQQAYCLHDLSAGGMGLLIPEGRILQAEKGQSFSAILVSPDQQQIEVSGEFQHQRKALGISGVSHIAGFKFTHPNPKSEQIVQSWVLDIYRSIFSRT